MVEDMGPYLDSLRKLKGTGLERFHPGHGEEMSDPDAVIDWYLAHRLQRHEEILVAIANGASTIEGIVEEVYREVDPALHPLAARSALAHVTLLIAEGRISSEGDSLVAAPDSP